MYKYRGSCQTEHCERNNELIVFEVAPNKVEAFTHEPPICPKCGRTLTGAVIERKVSYISRISMLGSS